MDNYTPFAGEGGTYASSSEKYGVLDLPTALDPNTVDLGSLAPLYGLKGDPNYEPDYLDYNMKGRGGAEKYPYNCGYMYLLGMIAGGGYGAVQGNRTSPSTIRKIRVNSILNGIGYSGSRLGNGLGILAFFYTTTEYGLTTYTEVDQWLGGQQWVNPVIAAGVSGMLFRCTSRPKTMALAGAVGVLGMSAWVAAEGLFASMFLSRPTRSSSGRRLPA